MIRCSQRAMTNGLYAFFMQIQIAILYIYEYFTRTHAQLIKHIIKPIFQSLFKSLKINKNEEIISTWRYFIIINGRCN